MLDWLLCLLGKITKEERLYRRIHRQSLKAWYRDYDRAGK